MKNSKRQKLEAAGWKVGSTADFLGLSKEEELLIDMKLALANKLKARRQERKLTQLEIAKRLGSSQSRIAKMEVADKSVSLDLLVRSLLSLGATRQDIAGTIGAPITKKKAIALQQRSVPRRVSQVSCRNQRPHRRSFVGLKDDHYGCDHNALRIRLAEQSRGTSTHLTHTSTSRARTSMTNVRPLCSLFPVL